MIASIFLDFHLPNATSWFYLSLPLATALFFQFRRPFCLRNLDLLALYLFAPGMLLIQDAQSLRDADPHLAASRRLVGYIVLLGASALWLIRSLLDLLAGRRTTFHANMTLSGLAFFGITLFIGLASVAIRRPAEPMEPIGKSSAVMAGVTDRATAVVAQTQPPADADEVRAWVERVLALAGHAAVIVGLFFIGLKHYRDAESGVAMATFYLLLPYTAYHIGQWHHVLPAALTVWAVYCYRHPRLAGWLLGLAAGAAFFPVLLFPVWFHLYWKRGPGRFAVGFLSAGALGAALTILVLWSAGLFPEGLTRTLHLSDWQPWKKATAEGLWAGVHWAYRLPVFIAYAAFVLALFVWPPVRTMTHAVALSAAVLLGVQFWYAERGGLYVLWYLPLLILMVFRPTTTDLEPPMPAAGTGWGVRLIAAGWQRVRRRPGHADPPALAV